MLSLLPRLVNLPILRIVKDCLQPLNMELHLDLYLGLELGKVIAFELLSKQGKDPIQMPPPKFLLIVQGLALRLFAFMHPLMMVVVDMRLVLKPRLLSLSVGSNGKDDTGLYAVVRLP